MSSCTVGIYNGAHCSKSLPNISKKCVYIYIYITLLPTAYSITGEKKNDRSNKNLKVDQPTREEPELYKDTSLQTHILSRTTFQRSTVCLQPLSTSNDSYAHNATNETQQAAAEDRPWKPAAVAVMKNETPKLQTH